MRRSREILIHILRTLALVGALASACIVILFLLPPVIALPAMLVGIALFIFYTGRLHAHWAPIADTIARFRWADEQGYEFETVVERAKIDAATLGGASAVKSRVLRLSLYSTANAKRKRRVLIGDDATYLGRHGERLWFFIRDRYHSGRDGLVGHDLRELGVSFHISRRVADWDERSTPHNAIVHLAGPNGPLAIDLGDPIAPAPG
jgi:hypothetical protein